MKSRSFTSKILFFALAGLLSLTWSGAAQAQVVFEGTSSYRMTRYGNRITTEGQVTKVSNYNYIDYSGVQLILGLSKKPYIPESSLKGMTVAKASLGNFPARTYFTGIKLGGNTNLPPSGTYRVVLLAIDGGNKILTGINFSKKISVGKPVRFRAIARAMATAQARAAKNENPDAVWSEQ